MSDDKINEPADKIFESNIQSFHTDNSRELLKRIKPISHDDLIKEKPISIEYILYPWLPNPGIAFVYAAAGVGKTLFTMNAAYAIASGGNFLKYKAPKPRKVLYVDGEMPFYEIHNRYLNIVRGNGKMYFPENWNIFTPQKVLPEVLPKICSPDGQLFYNEVIKDNKIEVLILDNLSSLSSIDDSNVEQWKVIQDWIVHLRSTGVSVIIVHHAGKDKNGYRGTSKMLDCADTAISLQQIKHENLEEEIVDKNRFKIVYQKSRSFHGADAQSFEICLSSLGWNFQSIDRSNLELVVERYHLDLKYHEIAKELNIDRSYVGKLIKKAKALGMII